MLPKLLSSLVIIFFFAAPLALSAHGFPPTPLVPDCNTILQEVTRNSVTTKEFANPCGFDDLMHLVSHLIDFAIYLAIPLSAVLFAWAGWLYLSSGGSQGKVDAAHKIFKGVAWGLFWTLAAWFVVDLISDALLKEEFKIQEFNMAIPSSAVSVVHFRFMI